MDEWKHQMQFNRESSIWRLDPVKSTNPGDFFSELLLVRAIANVLDNGIAEHDIKSIFLKGQHKAVGGDEVYGIRTSLQSAREIHNGKTRPNRQELTDVRRSSDIENARVRGHVERLFKYPHPSRPKMPKGLSKQIGMRHSLLRSFV